MERFSLAIVIVLALFATSCSKEKTMDSVFPGANKGDSGASGECKYQEKIANQYIVQWEDSSITVEKAADLDGFVSEFVEPQLEKIRRVEFDSRVYLHPTSSGDVVSVQDSTNERWGQEAIEVYDTWSQGLDGHGAVVAVIDSGTDTFHSLLKDKIAFNANEIAGNGIDDDNNGFIDDHAGYDFYSNSGEIYDVIGHGTHVAGIIAGGTPNARVSGVAHKAKILPLNFMAADGGGAISDAIRAIEYAVSRKVDVINASWGGAPCSQLLGETIVKAGQNGVLFVAASGNNGSDIGRHPEYPASYDLPTQITVGASTSDHLTAFFSNYHQSIVHIVAPGEDIFSTMPNESYASLRGTSMAAPFVSGVAAILKGAFPGATPQQIKRAILESVDAGPFAVYSGGRLNARKAHDRLSQILRN